MSRNTRVGKSPRAMTAISAKSMRVRAVIQNSELSRRPLRSSRGHPVTQLWYARQGVITPEMEFIAIRENQQPIADCGLRIADFSADLVRNDLMKQHAGSSQLAIGYTPQVFRRFPQRIP